MAVANVPATTEKMEALLQCPICLSTLQEPLAFHCLHFFCKACIDSMNVKMQGKERGLECPNCREFSIKENLRPMHFIHEMLELVEQARIKDKKCQKCNGVPAEYRCIDCKQDMCLLCRGQHDEWPILQAHTWHDINKTDKPVTDRPVCCERHPNNETERFCKQCKELICALCKTTEHKNHKNLSLQNALQDAMATVAKKCEDLKENISKGKQSIMVSKKLQKTLSEELHHIELQLDTMVDEFLVAVDSRKKQIDIVRQTYVSKTMEATSHLEIQLKAKETVIAVCDTSMKMPQDATLLKTLYSDILPNLESSLSKETAVVNDAFPIHVKYKSSDHSIDDFVGEITVVNGNQTQTSTEFAEACHDVKVWNVPRIGSDIPKQIARVEGATKIEWVVDDIWVVNVSELIHVVKPETQQITKLKTGNIGDCCSVAYLGQDRMAIATEKGVYMTDTNLNQKRNIERGDMLDVAFCKGKYDLLVLELDDDKHYIINIIKIYGGYGNFELIRYLDVLPTVSCGDTIHSFSALISTKKHFFLSLTDGEIYKLLRDGALVDVYYPEIDDSPKQLHLCGVENDRDLIVVDQENNAVIFMRDAEVVKHVLVHEEPISASFRDKELFVLYADGSILQHS